jgi:hypothetical protein
MSEFFFKIFNKLFKFMCIGYIPNISVAYETFVHIYIF